MKKIVCICIVLAAIICMLVSCANEEYELTSISLKDKCDVAFNYFDSKDTDISFYDIEEYEYKSAERAELFDEGTIYKITVYINSGREIFERIFYLGKLNGDDILYRADYHDYSQFGYSYKLYECKLS